MPVPPAPKAQQVVVKHYTGVKQSGESVFAGPAEPGPRPVPPEKGHPLGYSFSAPPSTPSSVSGDIDVIFASIESSGNASM